ncbi:hypothetical protein A7J58_00415 [Enterobacter cloacae]|nr:hypothetical protein A7J56_00400 [Enterobacter cloacae]OAE68986.1 hypothetical protein A7J58_00415 [Enterobacter cloacae]
MADTSLAYSLPQNHRFYSHFSVSHRHVYRGVESAKEDTFLTKNGVNERQGYLFAKPMPADAFERWLKRYQARNAR